LIDEVRKNREELVREHGRLRGLFDFIRQKQKKHPDKIVSRFKEVGVRPHLKD
jgi:hypothetical protein